MTVTGDVPAPDCLVDYGYNTRGELTGATRTDTETPPNVREFTYTYDHIGNRTQHTDDGGTPGTLHYCPNDLNQYDTTYTGSQSCPPNNPAESFEYDADGNLVQDGTFNYTWDAENRLIGAEPINPAEGSKKVAFRQ